MYTVECDGEVFYNDVSLSENVVLIEPNLELNDNSAGSFEFTIPPSNVAYNKCKEMTSTITVKKNGRYLWSGRIVTLNVDFYGRKKATCEGALAYLNDVIILPKTYEASTIYELLSQVLEDYREKVSDSRKIYMGAVTVHREDTVNKYEADYITCFDFINENLIDPFSGHLFITRENGLLKLNYYAEHSEIGTARQTIDFGINLLDFAKDFDYTDICTVCIPRGKQQSNNAIVDRSGTDYNTAYNSDSNAVNNYNSGNGQSGEMGSEPIGGSGSNQSGDGEMGTEPANGSGQSGDGEMGTESINGSKTRSASISGFIGGSSSGEGLMGEETSGSYSHTYPTDEGQMGEEELGVVYTPNSNSLNAGTKLYNSTDPSTVLTSGEDYSNQYITVEDVNGGSPYVENEAAVKTYGRIERVVDFDDVEDPMVLLKLAQNYMKNLQFDKMTLTVKAVDLHMLDPSITSFNWLEIVHCVSIPHGMDTNFPIKSVSIPLDQPENIEYTLGRIDTPSLSGVMAVQAAKNQSKFNGLPTRESVLVAAKRNATEILNRKTAGYVNIIDQGDHSEAIIISNIVDWQSASNYWKFDMNGLGFYKNGKLGGIAITLNGEIVADYITTGTLSADRIQITGIIKDAYNNNFIDLGNGSMLMDASKMTFGISDASGKHKGEIQSDGRYTLKDVNDRVTKNGSSITSISQKQTTIETNLKGITTRVSNLEANYGTCSSAAAASTKVVSCSSFTQLKEGAVIVVKFTYGNTAVNPKLKVNTTDAHWIMINGKNISGKYNWKAGETVTFVYGGTWWNIADGSTESKIQQLADSITLSVTGKLGNTAYIAISASSDGKVATNSEGNSYTKLDTIDLSEVKKAFATDTSTVECRAGQIHFFGGTFRVTAGNITISSNGTLNASNAVLQGKVIAGSKTGTRLEMDNAQLIGYISGQGWIGSVSPNSGTTDIDTHTVYKGMLLRGRDIIDIRTPRLAVINSNSISTSVTSIYGVNATFTFCTDGWASDDGSVGWNNRPLQFINGILVTDPNYTPGTNVNSGGYTPPPEPGEGELGGG